MTNDDKQFVFSTDDQETVAAFKEASEAFVAAKRRTIADAAALPNVKAPTIWTSALGDKVQVTGLAPVDPAGEVPEGWRYLVSRRRFEPAKGQAGAAARAWLADHQVPADGDVREVMARHGLPKFIEYGGRTGLVFGKPGIELLGGTLWARFEGGEPEGCTWTPRRLRRPSERRHAHLPRGR